MCIQVPEENEGDESSVISSSTPKKAPDDVMSNKCDKPARPPPPILTPERPLKNTSALHHKISPRNVLSALSGITSAVASPLKPNGIFSLRLGKGNSPISCKNLAFTSSPRPLPDTPNKPSEEGDFYCEIEEEDVYEESDADGNNLLNGKSPHHQEGSIVRQVPVVDLPPPLPSRGLPPVPNIEKLIDKNKALLEDNTLLENYDIPGVNDLHSLPSKRTEFDSTSSTRVPHDLSKLFPDISFQSWDRGAPPIPDKSGSSPTGDEDDNVYKVPSSALTIDNIYQVPPAKPIPVNRIILVSSRRELQPAARSPSPLAELYQCPAPEAIPVNTNHLIKNNVATTSEHIFNKQISSTGNEISNNINQISKTGKENSELLVSDSSKIPVEAVDSQRMRPQNIPTSSSTSSVFISKGHFKKKITVKERIALINKETTDGSPEPPAVCSSVKSDDDLVILLDNREIRLDQAKKRAFLESTLDFNAKSSIKVDPTISLQK